MIANFQERKKIGTLGHASAPIVGYLLLTKIPWKTRRGYGADPTAG
jgi:hypothetical protein